MCQRRSAMITPVVLFVLSAVVVTTTAAPANTTAAITTATPVSLELNTASAFDRVRPGAYVGFTLSFLRGQDDPLWANTSILAIDLDDPSFEALVANLAPGLVRVGGGGEWRIVYDVDGRTCAKRKTPPSLCLTMPRWRAILAFAQRTGVQLIWGLGAQNRANGTAPLDFSANIRPFLAYTASLGAGVFSGMTLVTSTIVFSAGGGPSATGAPAGCVNFRGPLDCPGVACSCFRASSSMAHFSSLGFFRFFLVPGGLASSVMSV